MSFPEIARDMGLSRPTVRKHLNIVEEPKYARQRVCPTCKAATLIPANTPAGRKLVQQFAEVEK